MKHLLAISFVLLTSVAVAHAEHVVREIAWSDQPMPEGPGINWVVGAGPEDPFMIENLDAKPKTLQILAIEPAGISTTRWAIAGSIRYEDVAGQSYLEMWSHFPNGESFFSRTLASSGLLQRIKGSSPWRAFSLLFVATSRLGMPSRLQVNIVFAGKGKIWLTPVRLVQYQENEDPFGVAGAWWSDQQSGLFGGIAGSVLGCLGAVIGTLAGTGKARSLVMALMIATLVTGIGCLLAGVVALSLGQGYAVYYPLLLLGVIATLVTGPLLPKVRRRYEEIELRKMSAVDASRGPSTR